MSVKQNLIFYCVLSQIQHHYLEKTKPNHANPVRMLWGQCGSNGGDHAGQYRVLVTIIPATKKQSSTQGDSAEHLQGWVLAVGLPFF